MDQELKALLKSLPERKRRTFLRYMNRKDKPEDTSEDQKEDLLKKLQELKVTDKDSDDLDFNEFGSDISDEEYSDSDDN